jgi:hypothetical protein
VKVGFVPAPPPAPAPAPGQFRPMIAGRGPLLPELKEGDEYLFFLHKHPTAGFLAMNFMSPPMPVKGEDTEKTIEQIKKLSATLANPMAALKADKPADRFTAAMMLIAKYRAYSDRGGEIEQTPIPAEESKLILKGLTEGDWLTPNEGWNAFQLVSMLGLNTQDGWKQPMFKPGQNPNAVLKQAFTTWLNGPGKDYVIKRIAPKAK